MLVYCAKIDHPGLKGHVRDIRPTWLLEELKVPYEARYLDFAKGEHKAPAYLKVHPLGSVPALVDGELTLFESAAICTYIADKHAGAGLIPLAGTPARTQFDQWSYFALTTVEPLAVRVFGARVFADSPAALAAVLEEFGPKLRGIFAVLERRLADHAFILGERFSVADIFMGAAVAFAELPEFVEAFPRLAAYEKKLRSRPAFAKAYAASTGF